MVVLMLVRLGEEQDGLLGGNRSDGLLRLALVLNLEHPVRKKTRKSNAEC